jgi:hypothetical protein
VGVHDALQGSRGIHARYCSEPVCGQYEASEKFETVE